MDASIALLSNLIYVKHNFEIALKICHLEYFFF